MKRSLLSLSFGICLSLAFLVGLFVAGPALTPGADVVEACDTEIVCNFYANPPFCCVVDCEGNVGPCIFG
ncbi:MAG TPA: hypothetical protein VLV83_02765 [Acidobacteriota bacterium]|nr:hypothetical protein [Acidobacteriota bacterium]